MLVFIFMYIYWFRVVGLFRILREKSCFFSLIINYGNLMYICMLVIK